MAKIPEGKWTVAQGMVEGRAMIVRINSAARALVSDAELRHRIGVAVPLLAPDADGMPSAQESQRLNDVEDALCAAFDDGRRSVELLVITTSGMREFVFHTSDPHHVDRSVPAVRAQFPEYQVQLIIEEDTNWDVYQQLASAL
jgi:hypothetical protein